MSTFKMMVIGLFFITFALSGCSGVHQGNLATSPEPWDVEKSELIIIPGTDCKGNVNCPERATEAYVVKTIPEEKPAPATKLEFSSVYFDYDMSNIKDSELNTLNFWAGYLLENPDTTATIKGHCDERGTDAYNMALGFRRAASAQQYIINKGVDASRIKVRSYGESQPAVDGHNEQAWAKNRRAVLVIE